VLLQVSNDLYIESCYFNVDSVQKGKSVTPPIPGKGRKSLTRKQIIEEMQVDLKNLNLPNKLLNDVLNAFFEVYKEAILDNERVEIRGFGIMKSELIRGRLISHPETGEQVVAAPYYRISFIPSQSFRTKLKSRAKVEASKK
jgi:nucleoid DNA-binding protein